MLTSFRNLRPVLNAALLAASLTVGVTAASAQSGTALQIPYAAGLDRAKIAPYNFTGRVFALGDLIEFGSGTLLRRHTVLSAGHVLYDPTVGFTTSTTFTRALYGNYQLQSSQVSSVAVLGGYQSAVDLSGNTSSAAFQQDQGYLLLATAPVDENWADFTANPALLTSPKSQFFVLGYPGVNFDGRTLAYVVPQVPYVPTGTSAKTGSYSNTDYSAESGMSGGPVYVVLDNDPAQRYVAADTVGGIDDSSGTFNASFVRAIDKSSKKFLSDAEYTAGLVKKVKVAGPGTVARGTTQTYTIKPVFRIPTAGGGQATTDRYAELKLRATAVAVAGQSGVTVKKTSNTTFDVTFANSTTLRPGSTVTLQVYYDGQQAAPGKSFKTVKIQ